MSELSADWEHIYRHYKHIQFTEPDRWVVIRERLGREWTKLERLAKKKGWK